MPTPQFDARVRRLVERWHATLGSEVRRLREDAGLSRRALALAAGVDPAFLGRIEDARERASAETLTRLALVLGADFSAHLYPNTGPTIRDRHQARILEELLASLHPRWQPHTEVSVRRPARGSIDAVLFEARERVAVATEIQSSLGRLEQLVRWSDEKASSLPSADAWAAFDPEPSISRLLIVRRTRTTRETASAFRRQLRAAFLAHPDDALEALRGTAPWPGPAMVWAVVDSDRTRLVGGR
jgi:transcriptional regulator with XRE-family HTH domain